jgi:hypothetical protein
VSQLVKKFRASYRTERHCSLASRVTWIHYTSCSFGINFNRRLFSYLRLHIPVFISNLGFIRVPHFSCLLNALSSAFALIELTWWLVLRNKIAEVLMMAAFWDIAQCSLVVINMSVSGSSSET